MDFSETKYGRVAGFLYPYDLRHDATDRAFLNPLPDGRVQKGSDIA